MCKNCEVLVAKLGHTTIKEFWFMKESTLGPQWYANGFQKRKGWEQTDKTAEGLIKKIYSGNVEFFPSCNDISTHTSSEGNSN